MDKEKCSNKDDFTARFNSIVEGKKKKKKYVMTCTETNNHDNTYNTWNLVFKTKREAMAMMKTFVEMRNIIPYENLTWYDKQTCSIYATDDRSESRYVTDFCVREAISYE